MQHIGPAQILLALLTFILLAVLASMLMAWGWLIWRLLTRQPILPEQPMVARQEPTWGLWTVLLIVLLYLVVGYTLSHGYALATGRGPGHPTPPLAGKNDNVAQAAEKQLDDKVVESPFATTEMMFVNAVAQVIMLVMVPLVVRWTSGARLRDLGLTLSGWWRQAAVGVVAMLITTPVVLAVQFGATSIWRPHSHPLEKMLREHFSVEVGYLALVTGVILAPMLEETTFRAIFQGWLIKWMRRREHSTPPLDIDLEPQGPKIESDALDSAPMYYSIAEPAAVVLAEPVGEKVAESGRAIPKAIVVTSLFFAVVHAAQWPAPIPIFVLSFVLGTVYYRTGSLIASVCMHGAFNLLSTLVMFFVLLGGAEFDGKKTMPEAMHALPVLYDDSKQPEIRSFKLE